MSTTGPGDERLPAADPALAYQPTVAVVALSIWFGPKVALSEVTCSFGPGITGLLGPNGAGKTTLMRTMVGLLPPNSGAVRVVGRDPRADREVHRLVSLVPEEEPLPEALSARRFVRYVASLHGVAGRDGPERALAAVGLTHDGDRQLREFSKGMRQRAKLAATLVTDPRVLVLDEPLNGTDPVQRAALIELMRALGSQGRTVVVSSHVLHEVEALAGRVIVLLHGRIAAAGDHRAIRDAMADRPRRVLVRTERARPLAAALVGLDAVAGVWVDGDQLTVGSSRARELAVALPRLARSVDARLLEVRPLDDSLESLFRELVR